MAVTKTQNYKNHRNIAWGNYLSTMVMGGAVALTVQHFYRNHSVVNALWILVALTAVYVAYRTRANALKVQDRLIRLEEHLRYERILPAGLKARIHELDLEQVIAIRFAADGEVEGLVEKALSGTKAEELKKGIKTWRADWLRV